MLVPNATKILNPSQKCPTARGDASAISNQAFNPSQERPTARGDAGAISNQAFNPSQERPTARGDASAISNQDFNPSQERPTARGNVGTGPPTWALILTRKTQRKTYPQTPLGKHTVRICTSVQ